jgi:hypothetical protein
MAGSESGLRRVQAVGVPASVIKHRSNHTLPARNLISSWGHSSQDSKIVGFQA